MKKQEYKKRMQIIFKILAACFLFPVLVPCFLYHLPLRPMQNVNDDLQQRWWNLEAKLAERFGKKPDMEAILFLIGMQETNFIKEKITKEEKQDLMHVAVCTVLAPSGIYALEGHDNDGWPHFKQLKDMPVVGLIEQENFLKDHVLLYFNLQGI